eukprot:747703-Hanusia_phi.AAC.1
MIIGSCLPRASESHRLRLRSARMIRSSDGTVGAAPARAGPGPGPSPGPATEADRVRPWAVTAVPYGSL